MVTFIGIRSSPRTLPTPPWRRRRRTLCPLLISASSFFFLFQLPQGRQSLCKVRSVLRWHSIGTCLVWMKPPITLVERVFLWSQMVGMIFICKSIPLSTNIFVPTIFNHSITECFIFYKPVMDTLEERFLALLLQLVGRKVFSVSRLFTISMSVRSSFLDDVLRNWKKVHRILDEFLIFPSSFTQEVHARAIDDANVPVW